MGTPLPTGSPGIYETPPGAFDAIVADAMRFWELRRLLYNLVLSAVVVAWIVATWPHFRPMFKPQSILLLTVLALVANVCYCAAYLIDIPIQCSAVGGQWKRRRWTLWVAGMLLAILLANYWIVDEIYPFVQ